MRIKHSRKASLNISIEVIVIIVIAMTLLGLGLAFVRGQFKQITATAGELQEQVRQQIIDTLTQSKSQKSYVPNSIALTKNDEKVIGIGVQNTGASTLYFKLDLSFDPANSDVPADTADPQAYLSSLFDVRHDKNCLTLSPAEANAYPVKIKAPRIPGTFAWRINILQFADEACTTASIPPVYETKLSFISVG